MCSPAPAPLNLLRNVLLSRRAFGSTILRIVYGVDPSSPDDELLALEEETMRMLNAAHTPGKYLVEAFPCLKYLPSWFPGAGFKTTAAECRIALDKARNVPFNITLDDMVSQQSYICSRMA